MSMSLSCATGADMTMSFYGDEMTPDEHKAPQGEGLRQTIRSLVDSVFGGTATGTVSWDSRTVPGWTEGMIKFVTVLLSPESYNNFFKGEAYVTARAPYELHSGRSRPANDHHQSPPGVLRGYRH